MYPLCEKDCLFEVVRVTGLIDGMDVFAEIRSCKVVEHDFIRRKLWLSSKKTGKLGKKPTTYLAKTITVNHGAEKYEMRTSTDDNIVFETKECAGFANATSNDVIPLNRYVEFNNTFFFARNYVLKLQDLAFACNQNVEKVFLRNTNIYFSTILELLPNLSWIIYYDKLEDGWEKELWYRRNQLKFVSIYPTKVTNFKMFSDLCRNGMEIEIDHFNFGVEFDLDELQEYFQTSETVLDGLPKPLFSIGGLLCYLKDPKSNLL
uniref:Uncharacterized protein n=1 Tax=Panagrolaimus sp. JU765 TaxID=591449 RepID=A0AC34RQC8_9BILA